MYPYIHYKTDGTSIKMLTKGMSLMEIINLRNNSSLVYLFFGEGNIDITLNAFLSLAFNFKNCEKIAILD